MSPAQLTCAVLVPLLWGLQFVVMPEERPAETADALVEFLK